MMQVELIDYQANALDILIYTKNTRLRGEFPTLRDVERQPDHWKLEQLAYMRDTIQSSWEFVDYIFQIEGVSRNFTHQLVRTRTASFAQEAQRVVDLGEADFYMPKTLQDAAKYPEGDLAVELYKRSVAQSTYTYRRILELGFPRQDARNVVPTGVLTNIMIKANLRTLHNMAELRLCFRVQDEYQQVFRAMKACVVDVHPWAEKFIQVYCVNHATCAFPRYDKCPVQKHTFHGKTLDDKREIVKAVFEQTEHEAQPIANKDGMTM
jgi:flavin-dependent thymidylate synthase